MKVNSVPQRSPRKQTLQPTSTDAPPSVMRDAQTMPDSTRDLPERVSQLELSVQKDCSDLSSHEEICGLRYAGIITALSELKGSVSALTGKVEIVAQAQITNAGIAQGAAEARKPKWWVAPAATIAAVLIAAVIGLMGWMGGRLVTDNDRMIAAAQDRPAAAVTVNPAPAEAAPTQAPVAAPAPTASSSASPADPE